MEKIDMEKRRATNKKILKVFGGIIAFIILLALIGRCSETNNVAQVEEKQFNMDSLITEIKKDKSFDIKEIQYNAKDSSLNIAISNKNSVIKKRDYSARYFNTMFFLDSIPKIEGVYLYAYNKDKPFQKKEYLDGFGQRFARYKNKFDKQFINSWDGSCRPVEKYLKSILNDPSSLEINNTWNLGMNNDSTFSIKTVFRAKNQFNATVLQTLYCDVDIEGNISNIKKE
jgi:hypothetical protein